MSDLLLPNYDRWLDAPYERDMDARADNDEEVGKCDDCGKLAVLRDYDAYEVCNECYDERVNSQWMNRESE